MQPCISGLVQLVKTEELRDKPALLRLWAKQASDRLLRDGTVSYILTGQQQNIQNKTSVANSQPKSIVSSRKIN
jgi:hypothetical protein